MEKYSWKRPTTEEIKKIVKILGGNVETAKLMGLSIKTIGAWKSGVRNMKKSSWVMLKSLSKSK